MLTVTPQQRGDSCKGYEAISLVPFLDLTLPDVGMEQEGGRERTPISGFTNTPLLCPTANRPLQGQLVSKTINALHHRRRRSPGQGLKRSCVLPEAECGVATQKYEGPLPRRWPWQMLKKNHHWSRWDQLEAGAHGGRGRRPKPRWRHLALRRLAVNNTCAKQASWKSV